MCLLAWLLCVPQLTVHVQLTCAAACSTFSVHQSIIESVVVGFPANSFVDFFFYNVHLETFVCMKRDDKWFVR